MTAGYALCVAAGIALAFAGARLATDAMATGLHAAAQVQARQAHCQGTGPCW